MHRNDNVINPLNTIGAIRIQLRGLLSEREKLIKEHKEIWNKVKREKRQNKTFDYSEDLKIVNSHLGDITNKVNRLIGSLIANYTGNDKAMDLAIEYLNSEIERDKGILRYREDCKECVAKGISTWIHPDGSISTDPNLDNDTIYRKKSQIERLTEMLNSVYEIINKKSTDKKITIDLKLDDLEDEDYIIPDVLPNIEEKNTEDNDLPDIQD